MNRDPTPSLPTLWMTGKDRFQPETALHHEWMLSNGLGGYACGTVAGCNTRKYHGLFIPCLTHKGRMVMLPQLEDELLVGGRRVGLYGREDTSRGVQAPGLEHLVSFGLHGLVPEWHFKVDEVELVRRVLLVHGENTVFVTYTQLAGPPVKLVLRPFLAFRSHEGELEDGSGMPSVNILDERVEFHAQKNAVPLRTRVCSLNSAPFVSAPAKSEPLLYRTERARGYHATETLRSPGYFDCDLEVGQTLSFGATLDAWENVERDAAQLLALELQREVRLLERAPVAARTGTAARLVLAADQFVIEPSYRSFDEAWARASGIEVRSIIAGYPWFTDWGRDTMISLEGLTLCTGRHREAAAILRTFAHHLRDGLLPNYFPDGEHQGVYHTADATLWYFHAVDRYLATTGDLALVNDLFPALADIVDHHVRGTRFGIRVDPQDGLLVQGAPGYQLTWMDAKVDGWVVTPRRGKAVEINALWFNALRITAELAEKVGADPRRYLGWAEQAQVSFNRRFWNESKQCLYDVVDAEQGGDDPAVRPNQVFSISLKNPVLSKDHWTPVLDRVRELLLTPVGLRTLSPRNPDYKPTYDGDLRSRDAAYHQGTVWPWLLGHFVDASVKASGDKGHGRQLLLGLEDHLQHHACLGQVSEIFDATEPYRPRGCFAQAWSVAEFLRLWVGTS